MILSAFQKTGIHPFHQNAIPLSAFEPVKNMTMQAMQPLPAQLPSILTLTPSPAATAAAVLTLLATPTTSVAPPSLGCDIAITMGPNNAESGGHGHGDIHLVPNKGDNTAVEPKAIQWYHIEVPSPLPNAAS